MDALNLLKQDHRAVEKLFQNWERAGDATEQHHICQQVCTELGIHSEIEEQCFYPGVRSMAGLEDKVDESLREHVQVKQLCGQIAAMSAGDGQLQSRMTELKQAVEHHVKEEEQQMFPQVRETCDQQWLLGLGHAMEQQKVQLQGTISAETAPGEPRIREDVRDPSRSETRR